MAAHFLPRFLTDQFFRTPPPSTRSFANETIIITGANTGLGKEAALQITALGAAKVIIACRTVSKGEEAQRDIEAKTGKTGVIEVWPLDLASYASVQDFARRCNTLPRIDAVVENAGCAKKEYTKAEDNEATITVNVISTFLLMLLLLPKLREVAKTHKIIPRLSIMSSALYEIAPLKARNEPHILDAMNDPAKADMVNRYQDSKLLEVLYLLPFFEEQASRGSSGDVIVNVPHPGFCQSDLLRELESVGNRIGTKIIGRSTQEGARAHVYAAGAGPDSHGKWQTNGKNGSFECTWPVSKQGQEVCAKIFAEVNEKLEKIVPGVTANM